MDKKVTVLCRFQEGGKTLPERLQGSFLAFLKGVLERTAREE